MGKPGEAVLVESPLPRQRICEPIAFLGSCDVSRKASSTGMIADGEVREIVETVAVTNAISKIDVLSPIWDTVGW